MASEAPHPTPGILLPPASPDEQWHALATASIIQSAALSTLTGLVTQIYCTVNQLPQEQGSRILDQLYADGIRSATDALCATITERQEQLKRTFFN